MKITRKKEKVPVTTYKTVSVPSVTFDEREALLLRDLIGGSKINDLSCNVVSGNNRGNFTSNDADVMFARIGRELNELFPSN